MQATAKEVKLPPVKKGKKNFSVFPFVNGLFFLLFCLFILVPLWKVLVDSLDLTTGYGMKLWPENFGLAGYQSVFSNPTLLRPLMISVVTTVAGTFLGLFLSTSSRASRHPCSSPRRWTAARRFRFSTKLSCRCPRRRWRPSV